MTRVLLKEVCDYLSTGGMGTEGTNLFRGFLPDEPATALALYETGGMEPIRAMRPSPGQPVAQRPRLQLVSRSTSYDVALLRLNNCAGLLDGAGGLTLNGVDYKWIGAVNEPHEFDRDPSRGRVSLAQSYQVIKARSTA